ncbi:MAG TPA: hypothetical protein VF017_14785 [Thermoanaerobaculia bacterium]|nr:hypothetical protein [Thermoanaerobaculia bacterium]
MSFRSRFRSVFLLALAAAPLLAASQAEAAPAEDAKSGKVLADNGFRPKPNGFGFENWGGNQYPYSDLTADDAALLFGERVCARIDGGKCVPTPAAKLWIKEMNQMMKGGHCEGMAALSAAFYVKSETVDSYGAKLPFALKATNEELLRTISTYFVTQALEPVSTITQKTRGWKLQAIVDHLIQTISAGGDYPTLGIYGAEGGHAVTPYKVVLIGDGLYRIYVYDNNYPGAENFVDVDVKRDRWVYAGAALNPSEPASPWQGGAGSMDVTLLSHRYEPLHCPFCGQHKPPRRPQAPQPAAKPKPRPSRQPSVAASDYAVFTPNRCSQIQATRKKDKKRVRMGQAGLESQLEGAAMVSLRGARGCFVRLPAGSEYDLVLVDDGRPVYRPLTELVVFAPGSVYSITNISVQVSVSQSFSFSQSGFSYQAGGRQSPTLRVAGDAAGTNGYYEVSGFILSENSQFTAERSSGGQMAFHADGVDRFDIYAEAVGEEETEVFDFEGVEVGEDGQALLSVEEDGDIELDLDSDSDGSGDEEDLDDDNDGVVDAQDLDDDGDGTQDAEEPADFDDDGIPDAADFDDDNDGELDAEDADDSTEDLEDEDEAGDDEDDEGELEEDEAGDDEDDEAELEEDEAGDDEGDEAELEEDEAGDDEDDEAELEEDEAGDDEADEGDLEEDEAGDDEDDEGEFEEDEAGDDEDDQAELEEEDAGDDEGEIEEDDAGDDDSGDDEAEEDGGDVASGAVGWVTARA